MKDVVNLKNMSQLSIEKKPKKDPSPIAWGYTSAMPRANEWSNTKCSARSGAQDVCHENGVNVS